MLMASDVNFLDPLKDPLNKYGQQAQGSLQKALGVAQRRANISALASGRTQGQYVGQALGNASNLASRGINDALYGTIGNASLKDLQSQQEFERNRQLAEEIGGMMKPSMLQEILGGLGGGANLALTGKGIYDALGTRGSSSRGLSPNLSLFDPNQFGYARYQYGQ